MIVASGSWVYADTVERPVDIVGLDYDFWYELARADGQLEPGESPRSSDENGLLYYVRFRHAGEPVAGTWPDSGGHDTIDAAKHAAAGRVVGPISWSQGVAGPPNTP